MTATTLAPGQRVLVTEYGDDPVDAIKRYSRLDAQPAPDIAALGEHEVAIAIRSVAVAWVDLLMTSGQYQHMANPPYIPGMEYSGVVVGVGSSVDPAACEVGDRVLADFMKVGPRSGGKYQAAGGFASYAVVPVDAVLRIPDRLSFDDAVNLLGSYETAYHCLIARGRVQRGETVLINGASGLTGLASVQVAKLLGATVIALGRSDEKLATVAEQGADHVVNITSPGESGVRRFRDEVKELTGGRGVDVIYDAVGGETSLECLRCAAFGARFLVVGWTSTPFVANGKGQRGAPRANHLPTNLIQMKSLSVLGCPTGIAATVDPSIRPERLRQVMGWAERGEIAPYVSHTYPLAQYQEAMLARWNGEVTGACVLNP